MAKPDEDFGQRNGFANFWSLLVTPVPPTDDISQDEELLRLQQLTAQRADQLCRERICRAREQDLSVWLEAEKEILGGFGIDLTAAT